MKKSDIYLNRFFERYGISKTHFARLLGLTYSRAYCKPNEEAKKRIAIGMKIFEEKDLIYPDIHYRKGAKGVKQYEKNIKKSNSLDKKFAAAFKKAMK